MQRPSLTGIVLYAFVLMGLWLLWSGHYTPLMISFGIFSIAVSIGFGIRLRILDEEAFPYRLSWRALRYVPWLFWQIVLANLDVARRVLSPSLPISPTMRTLPASQKTDLGRVIYANSITLTPGTVSLWVDDEGILVHAISKEGMDDLAGGEMDRQVTWLEGLS